LILIVLTTFLGGIFNEIRLLTLFAPWMIVILLNFVRNYYQNILETMRSKAFVIYAVFVMIFSLVAVVLIVENRELLIPSGRFAVPYDQWIVASAFYIFIFLLSIPITARIYHQKKAPGLT
jgi:hypothetical protein